MHRSLPQPLPTKEQINDRRTRRPPARGVIILISLALAVYISHYWLWLTAFVGLNLFQSAITNWCPAMSIFRIMGLKDASCGAK